MDRNPGEQPSKHIFGNSAGNNMSAVEMQAERDRLHLECRQMQRSYDKEYRHYKKEHSQAVKLNVNNPEKLAELKRDFQEKWLK